MTIELTYEYHTNDDTDYSQKSALSVFPTVNPAASCHLRISNYQMTILLTFENVYLQLASKNDTLEALRIEVDILKSQLYHYFP